MAALKVLGLRLWKSGARRLRASNRVTLEFGVLGDVRVLDPAGHPNRATLEVGGRAMSGFWTPAGPVWVQLEE